jgi:hypothetical protein
VILRALFRNLFLGVFWNIDLRGANFLDLYGGHPAEVAIVAFEADRSSDAGFVFGEDAVFDPEFCRSLDAGWFGTIAACITTATTATAEGYEGFLCEITRVGVAVFF